MVRSFEHGREKIGMRSKLIHYLAGFTMGCVLLNIWFTAINAPSDFQMIYAALSGIFSAILVEGRKKRNEKNDRGDL